MRPYFIKLPLPRKDFSSPLIQALQFHRTKGRWRDEAVTLQEIADLLWDACCITVEETKRSKSKRCAPSGRNAPSVCVYAAAGLNTAVPGLVDREKLQGITGLSELEKVVCTQAVGKER